MGNTKAWVQAARLRTLPLSFSGIIVGTGLAVMEGQFDGTIFILALLTTVGFQVTSNFANDYGDGVKGTDNEDRIGPARAIQSGSITRGSLKKGIIISIVISMLIAIALIYLAFGLENFFYILIFFVLGLLSVWAAIKYTVGSNAYGYRGMTHHKLKEYRSAITDLNIGIESGDLGDELYLYRGISKSNLYSKLTFAGHKLLQQYFTDLSSLVCYNQNACFLLIYLSEYILLN